MARSSQEPQRSRPEIRLQSAPLYLTATPDSSLKTDTDSYVSQLSLDGRSPDTPCSTARSPDSVQSRLLALRAAASHALQLAVPGVTTSSARLVAGALPSCTGAPSGEANFPICRACQGSSCTSDRVVSSSPRARCQADPRAVGSRHHAKAHRTRTRTPELESRSVGCRHPNAA